MMKMDQEKISLKTIVGGMHIITNDIWALSLVRRLDKEHAFLLLEGVYEGRRVAIRIDLKCKEGTNNTKAEIVSRELNVPELIDLAADLHSITWNINTEQRKALQDLIEAEKLRSEAGLINYIMPGKSKVSGSVAASTEASGSYASHNASQVRIQERRENINKQLTLMPEESAGRWRLLASYISVESVDMLLRHGHNCYSWSVEVVIAIRLEYQESFFKQLVVRNPVPAIKGNSRGEDQNSTSTHCTIL
jgi:hypothetical protein